MLVKTGHVSISFVAGCCWVNSVIKPPPLRHEQHEHSSQNRFGQDSQAGRLHNS